MNETIKSLLERRSVRKYKNEQIKDEELQTVLEVGKRSPTGMNQQPLLFVVLQNKDYRDEMTKLMGIAKGGNPDPYYSAPSFVLIFADKEKITPLENATIAATNMFDAAHSIGIGTCWINGLPRALDTEEGKVFKRKLGVPDNYLPMVSFSMGYADETPEKKELVNDKVIIK